VDTGQFELRLRAPTGTRFEATEIITRKVLALIEREAGPGNVDISIGYVGTQPPNYALSNIYVWTSGPHEAVLTVALDPKAHIALAPFKEKLRREIPKAFPGLRLTFGAGDIVSKIMNFGAPTPVEVAVSGLELDKDRTYADKVLREMLKIERLRDVQFEQPLDYPTIGINIDRERAGQLGVTVDQVGRSLVEATSSSRWIQQNYWRDPKTGVSYQVQVELPQWKVGSIPELENTPVMNNDGIGPYVRDVASLRYGTMPGEIDHYNQMRLISVSANLSDDDLGRAAREVNAALERVGAPPNGVFVNVRGQIPTMKETFLGLEIGMLLAIVVIMLMLTANFQSLPLAIVVLSIVPAIIAGEVIALLVTGTTLNVQSFMGGIMAIGVGVSNAILLITFAEDNRLSGETSIVAATAAGKERLRPVLMTSIAMIAGMIPMALSADAQASLARAVIGGLLVSTPTVLFILPLAFSIVRQNATRKSASIHPETLVPSETLETKVQ
jgi:multidrug efflux pump subunit AcrB